MTTIHWSRNTHKTAMIYTDLIKLVGQYMTFEEFQKELPELELTQNDWYSILEGMTVRKHKTLLKKRYIEEFNDDWKRRRDIAFNLLEENE